MSILNGNKAVKIEGVEVRIVMVTPVLASKWLKMMPHNRKEKDKYVDRMVEAVKKNDWLFSGDTIKFNINDDLIDGQHRLKNIVKSDTPSPHIVVTGLSLNVMPILDSNIKRNFSDHLEIIYPNIKYATQISAAISRLWVYNKGLKITASGGRNGISTMQELLTEYKANTGIEESCSYVLKNKKRLNFLKPALAYAFHYILSRIDQEATDIFFTKLQGIDIDPENDSAIYYFVSKMKKKRDGKIEITKETEAAMFIKTWNCFITGKQVKGMNWNTFKGERFPKIKTLEEVGA